MAADTSIPSALSPLYGGARAIVTLAISVITAMTVLDTTIANVALPTIAGNLGVSPSQGTWVITFFGVANAVAIPLTGWLAKRLGEVRLYLWSTLLFVLSSWLCGIAWSIEVLIVFRMIQGAAAGPLIPLSQSLLLACYPQQRRPMALAFWSMTIVIAPILGPLLGGWICDNAAWGWIFFINVPLGLVALPLLRLGLDGRETFIVRGNIDRIGLVLLIVGVGSLQLMLDEGKDKDWFASPYICGLGVIALVCLVLLVAWELLSPHPVVDLRLFAYRNFTVGTICIGLGFMIYFASVVLLPMMLQTQLGYTAFWAGLAAAPIGFLSLFISPLIGKNAHRLDLRRVVTASFLIFSACFYWRTFFTPQMDFAFVVWPQFVQGLAVATFFMPLTNILLAGLPRSAIASASSLSNCVRVLLGSVGASLTTTLWERREALHHARLVESISPYNPLASEALTRLNDLGLDPSAANAYLAKEITRQGYIISFNEIFYLYAAIFIGLALLVWLAKPPFTSAGGAR